MHYEIRKPSIFGNNRKKIRLTSLILAFLVINNNSSLVQWYIQWNLNGSNSFGTTKIYSRMGSFELMSVNNGTRTEGKGEISFRFSLT